MTRVTVGDVRLSLADIVNQVAFGKERVVLERRGKDVAALVPMEDLALLEELEERVDVEDARLALAEAGSKTLEQLRGELGD